MRKALPVITEDAVLLKQRLQGEHHGRKRPRLQMLYLVATLLQAYDAPTLQALTGYAYLVEAINALCS